MVSRRDSLLIMKLLTVSYNGVREDTAVADASA
jgi:hypothetical protein